MSNLAVMSLLPFARQSELHFVQTFVRRVGNTLGTMGDGLQSDSVIGHAAGSIDYEEFLAATVNLNHLEKEETMYNAFQYFDTDNSGYITEQEMEDALRVTLMCCRLANLPGCNTLLKLHW